MSDIQPFMPLSQRFSVRALRHLLIAGAVASGLGLSAQGAQAQVTTQMIQAGQAAYAANCQGCHGVASGSKSKVNLGVDANKTRAAVLGTSTNANANSSMGPFNGVPTITTTDCDYNGMAAYIASAQPGAPTAVMLTPAVTCNFGPTTSTVTNEGNGGCTVGRADQPFDPLWALMLGAAGWVVARRRRPSSVAGR